MPSVNIWLVVVSSVMFCSDSVDFAAFTLTCSVIFSGNYLF